MTDAERLDLIRKALGIDTPLEAGLNLLGASMAIGHDENHVADKVCRQTIDRVLGQLREVRDLLQPPVKL